METINLFVVELEKKINDTITTDSGLELFIDTRFEGSEFKHRITEGPIVCSPLRHNTGAKKGDTLYFHHLVVLNEGQGLTGHKNHYMVQYDPNHTINNQAIAYKSAKVDTYIVSAVGLFSLLLKKVLILGNNLTLSKWSSLPTLLFAKLALLLTLLGLKSLGSLLAMWWALKRTEITS